MTLLGEQRGQQRGGTLRPLGLEEVPRFAADTPAVAGRGDVLGAGLAAEPAWFAPLRQRRAGAARRSWPSPRAGGLAVRPGCRSRGRIETGFFATGAGETSAPGSPTTWLLAIRARYWRPASVMTVKSPKRPVLIWSRPFFSRVRWSGRYARPAPPSISRSNAFWSAVKGGSRLTTRPRSQRSAGRASACAAWSS